MYNTYPRNALSYNESHKSCYLWGKFYPMNVFSEKNLLSYLGFQVLVINVLVTISL